MGYGGWDDPIDIGYNDPSYTPPETYPVTDPYANWGGGQGGDGSEIFNGGAQGTGMLTGGGGGGDWSSALRGFLNGGGGATSALGKSLSGLFGGSGNGLDGILGLLALLGGVGSSINAGNVAKQGGQQIKQASEDANKLAQGLFDKAQSNFQPYQTAGLDAIAKLQQPIDLASQFVSRGTPSALANKFSGAMSLAQLAKR